MRPNCSHLGIYQTIPYLFVQVSGLGLPSVPIR